MANITFFHDNKWDDISDIVSRTESSNFVAENTQLRDFNEAWRSRFGAGSTWGVFNITAANNKLDFKDFSSVTRGATITIAEYTAPALAAEIETQLEAETTDGFTVTYIESGADINKFNIENDAGEFQLLWNSGANKSNSIADTIGFDDTYDDVNASDYTADYVRIHSYELLKGDLGSAMNILAFIIRGHNIQSGATKNIQAHASDAWSSPTVSEAMTYGADIMGKIFSSVQSYRWWRALFQDADNSDGYIEVGRVFLGNGFQPTINFLSKSRVTKKVDPSIVKRSEAGQISTIQLDDYEVWQYNFRVIGSTQVGYFETMFDAVKKSLPLWICEDPDNFPAKTYYCQFVDWEWTPVYEVSDVYDLTIQVEELA